ncbi:alpha/beta fold hydrolase [Neokomagataea anthophila]|uniref:Alpha/beta hydrolase n=1 Tax=Neokomagataea anthophila TaxID=2826925 RepID=A0ABS5E6T7_9PROT|nr:hypothetical protein [Neokomagataea anthophila]MBR0559625.1 hypothetical protein [Neokomagataea anthophila]
MVQPPASCIRRTQHWITKGVTGLLMIVGTYLPPLYAAEEGTTKAILPSHTLDVAYYIPSGCTPRALLIVLASKNRDYRAFRDESIPLAQQSCSLIVAPYFPLKTYPPRAYQRGGFPENTTQPSATRLIVPLEQWTQHFAKQDLPIILIGHSAGAQFLNRVAAYTIGAERGIILMNPGSTVEPTINIAMPYGFAGSWNKDDASKALNAYLARPVIFLLGSKDTKSASFSGDAQADIEGEGTNRLQRGINTYNAGQNEAQRLKTTFGWHIVIVPGIGHDDALILGSPILERTVETLINRGSLQ